MSNQTVTPPLITIGLTCFNAQETIVRALESALSQDWPEFEVLIVDDCSTDNSVAAIEHCIADQPSARLVQHKINAGAAAARNTLLREAKGSFLVFFDDDDVSHPERVRVQYQRIVDFENEIGSKLIFCFASGRRRYPNGYDKVQTAIGSKSAIPSGEAVADYLLFNDRKPDLFYGSGTPTCALMARVEILRELGGFDTSLRRVEDVDLAVRLALAGGSCIGCPEELYLQYASVGSDKTPLKNLEAELAMLDKHSDYLTKKGRLAYARQWFLIRYLHFSGQRAAFAFRLAIFLVRFPVKGMRHLLRSGPTRVAHERKMKAEATRV